MIDRARTRARRSPAPSRSSGPPSSSFASHPRPSWRRSSGPRQQQTMAAELRDIRGRLTALAKADADVVGPARGRVRRRSGPGPSSSSRARCARSCGTPRTSSSASTRRAPGRTSASESSRSRRRQSAGRSSSDRTARPASRRRSPTCSPTRTLGLGRDAGSPISFDVRRSGRADRLRGPHEAGAIASFGLVAGATVGVEMLGMLGTLLGGRGRGPALLGVALVFGGKEVLSERRRQLDRSAPAGAIVPRRLRRGGPVRDSTAGLPRS